MVLSSVPVSVLGALLLPTLTQSLPHTTNGNSPGILRVPMSVSQLSNAAIIKRQHSASLNRSYRDHALMMDIEAGPGGQKLSLLVDTGSPYTWTNPNCENTHKVHQSFCKSLGVYKPGGTPEGKAFRITYSTGYANVVPYSTAIKLGGVEIPNQILGVATNSDALFSGILGVGPLLDCDKKYHILSSLVEHGYTESRAFSIDVAHKAALNDGKGAGDKENESGNTGSVVFGGVDEMRFSGKLSTLKMQPGDSTSYYVNVDDIGLFVGEYGFSLSDGNVKVSMDSGASHYYLPNDMADKVLQMFGGHQPDKDGGWKVPCANKELAGGFRIRLGDTNIDTSFADLIMAPQQEGDQYCHLRLAKLNSDKIVLGMPFFEAAYTVFDQDNGNIHVAKAANCGDSSLVKIEKGPNGVPLQGKC